MHYESQEQSIVCGSRVHSQCGTTSRTSESPSRVLLDQKLRPSFLPAMLLVLLGLLLAGVDAASAQALPRVLPYEISCPACRVEITKAFDLASEPSDPFLSRNLTAVTVDSRERFFFATIDESQVAVYGRDGRFITTIGRRGDGPGEFGPPIMRLAVGAGDTLHVFHSYFVSIFSPDLTFVRRVRLPAFGAQALLPGGRVLLGAQLRTSAQSGHPYHIVNSLGEVEHSFGYAGGVMAPDRPPPGAVHLRSDPSGTSLWGAPSSAPYTLIRWQSDGTKVDSLEFSNVPWLNEKLPEPRTRVIRNFAGTIVGTAQVGTGHTIYMMGVDSQSLIWLRVGTPTAAVADGSGLPIMSSRVEVFDPVSRSIVLSEQVQSTTPRILDGTNFGVSSVADQDGIARFTIWRVQIRGRGDLH